MLHPASIGKAASRRQNEARGSLLRRAFAEYLDAERRLGRVTRDADTDALATALIATIHHLLLTHSRKHDPRRDLRRVINAVIAGITPRAQRERRPTRRPAR
jgi:hypothetical protein